MHPSTVSRVINGDASLSVRPETIERILAAARRQGYRPNALARALRRDRTGALAFVVPLLRNPIWVRLQRGALQRAAERGYVVMMMEEPIESPKPPGDYRYLVDESRVDGLLLATALRQPAAGQAGAAQAGPGQDGTAVGEVPHVYVNRRGPERGNDVVMDEPGAVALFVDHIAGLGHRSAVLIDGPADVDTVHRRVAAFRRHGAAAGLDVTVRHAPPTEEGGYDTARRLLHGGRLDGNRLHGGRLDGGRLHRPTLPTACAVGSINQLFGALAAFREAGVAVPGDVSVVSFDEDECLAFLEVPVTSVCMPLAELGFAAVDALIARIEGGPAGDILVREPMSLVTRASVAPPPASAGLSPAGVPHPRRAGR